MDNRLTSILNFVPIGSRVADVGTDHGYLAVELIKQNIATFVIATDKNKMPLDSAKQNIFAAGVNDKVELRLGDGLQTINEFEIDTICIAGLGGSLICSILNESSKIVNSAEKIILQPMNAIDKVRQWCSDNHWHIEDEDLAEVDDIIYEILCINKTGESNSPTKKFKSPLLSKFIQNKIDKLQHVVYEMSKSPTAAASDKFFLLQKQIESLKINLINLNNVR